MSDVHVRTLRRAADIVGGPQQLALRIRVTPSHLALWMAGSEPPPLHIFLRAVDIVVERDTRALSAAHPDADGKPAP